MAVKVLPNLKHTTMNKYIFYFSNKQTEIEASSLYEAKQKAIAFFKPAKSKQHMVHGMIAEKDGEPVVHSTSSI